MTKTAASTSSSKPSKVGLVYAGDGFLDVPDVSLFGIAPGEPFEVPSDVADRLMADATVPVETITTGGNKA